MDKKIKTEKEKFDNFFYSLFNYECLTVSDEYVSYMEIQYFYENEFDLLFNKNNINHDSYFLLKNFLNSILANIKYQLSISIIKAYNEKSDKDGNNCFLLHIICYIEITLDKISEYYNNNKKFFNIKKNNILLSIIYQIKFYANKFLELIYNFISKNISEWIIYDYSKNKNNNNIINDKFVKYLVSLEDFYGIFSNWTTDQTKINNIFEKIKIKLILSNIFSSTENNRIDNTIDNLNYSDLKKMKFSDIFL
jgi:hypothetical protein